MKIILALIIIMVQFCSLTQNFTQSFIEADSGKYYLSLYLNVNDLKQSTFELKDELSEVPDIDSLKKTEFKKARNGYAYFAFKKTYLKVWYNTKRQSLVGDIKSINISNGDLLIGMHCQNGNFVQLRIINRGYNCIDATIKEVDKNGKAKVYFSEDCELNRYSI